MHAHAHADYPQYIVRCTHAQIACSLLKLEQYNYDALDLKQYNYMMHEVSGGIFAISGPTPDQYNMQHPNLHDIVALYLTTIKVFIQY